MADQFSRMYDVEVVGGDQKKRLAEMLRANALNTPQGQMVSGWYVPPSWSQNLAHLAQTATGVFGGIAADKEAEEAEMRDIQKIRAAKMGSAVRNYGQPQGEPSVQAMEPAYPSSPAAGQVQGGEFRAMKTGGVQGMPNYNVAQQPAQQQPEFDWRDPSQYESKFGKNFARQNMLQELMPAKYGTTPVKTDKGLFLVSETGQSRQLTDASGKPLNERVDYNDLVIMGQDGKPMINPLALQAKQAVARSGAANVSVNTGQKGFDNTLKLRGDFRSEPIYKGFQEVKGAFDQVREAAKLASPAGDLAAATKVMKILDPGSVVRESELGLALQASGLGDRVGNYANMIMTGQKLTPAQRKDFTNLSEQLYNASANQYNAKRGEYVGIAERNQLNVPDVVGEAAKVQKQVVRTGMMGGKKVVEYNDGTVEYVR